MSIVIGKVLLTPKGDYNPAFTYDPLDLVRHDHKSWVANIATSSTPSDTNPDWQLYSEDGNGIYDLKYIGVDPSDPDGLTDLYEMYFTNGTTFVYGIKNGRSGSGTGDMSERDYVTPATATKSVMTAKNLLDSVNNVTADTEVLAKFSKDPTTGELLYDGKPIGGKVTIDGTSIRENALNELEVPFDQVTLIIDPITKMVRISDAIIDKLPNQIVGVISGNTVSFTDATYIGGTDSYKLDPYISDTDRYVKSQTINGHTFTIVCDDVIASGAIAVCECTKL